MPNRVDKYKTIFTEKQGKPTLSAYIRLYYSFVSKSAESINIIFWAVEYWLKVSQF